MSRRQNRKECLPPEERGYRKCLPPEERGYRIRPYEPDDLKARLFTHTLPLLECYAEPHAPFHYLCIDDRKSNQKLRLVRVLYGPVLEVAYELESFNRKGAGILFYPSVIDGPTAKKEALRQFRSVWADVDCYKATQKFDIGLITPTPTAVVKTPGGYHLHWILGKAIEANKANIGEFEQYLRRIQAVLEPMGADAGVCNINACLRLPGFYSHKGKTTLVELEAIYGE